MCIEVPRYTMSGVKQVVAAAAMKGNHVLLSAGFPFVARFVEATPRVRSDGVLGRGVGAGNLVIFSTSGPITLSGPDVVASRELVL